MKKYQLVLVGIGFLMLAVAVLTTAPVVQTPGHFDAKTQQATEQADTFELACSPPPQCFRDRDCDSICGKRNGTCRRVNSCYNECICNQTLVESGA